MPLPFAVRSCGRGGGIAGLILERLLDGKKYCQTHSRLAFGYLRARAFNIAIPFGQVVIVLAFDAGQMLLERLRETGRQHGHIFTFPVTYDDARSQYPRRKHSIKRSLLHRSDAP